MVVVLVLFGGSQLPKLARNLGSAQKEFKDGMTDAERAEVAEPLDASSTASNSSTDGTE